jgi:hypothetical protein
MTEQVKKIERGEYIKKVIEKYMQTEPKLSIDDLAYILWELGDFGIYDIKKLINKLKKL